MHQPAPERPPEPALVVVAGLDADRRRVQADEQQPVAERRQVGQRLDGAAADLDRRHVAAGTGVLDLDRCAGRMAVHETA